MTLETLKDVYVDQLQDLYSADRQAADVTQDLADLARHEDLKAALKRGVAGIAEGRDTLASLIRGHGAAPTGEFCKGMEGLAREARAHAIETDFADDDVRDAVIISQYQRMAHYAIAGYGCCAAFARRLGLNAEAGQMQDCLDKTYHGDSEMSRLAIGEVNPDATATR